MSETTPPTPPENGSPVANQVPLVGDRMSFSTKLDTFEGPLDLLLYLIKENEVEITDIPIAAILQQYLSYMDEATKWDLHLAGEFLVMATLLMEIKSRELLPAQEQLDGEDIIEDPRSELVRQLLRYRRLKDQARALQQCRESWQRCRPRGLLDDIPDEPIDEPVDEVPVIDFDLYALFAAFEKIRKAILAQAPRSVQYEGEALEEKLVRIETMLKERPFARFSELVHDPSSRADIAMTFVALLELVRRRMIRMLDEEKMGNFSVKVQTESEAEDLARQEAEEADQVVDVAIREREEREARLRAEAEAEGVDIDKLPFKKRRAILARKRFKASVKPEDLEAIDAEDAEIGRRIDAILAAADVISQRFESGREAEAAGAEGGEAQAGSPSSDADSERPVTEADLEPRPELGPQAAAPVETPGIEQGAPPEGMASAVDKQVAETVMDSAPDAFEDATQPKISEPPESDTREDTSEEQSPTSVPLKAPVYAEQKDTTEPGGPTDRVAEMEVINIGLSGDEAGARNQGELESVVSDAVTVQAFDEVAATPSDAGIQDDLPVEQAPEEQAPLPVSDSEEVHDTWETVPVTAGEEETATDAEPSEDVPLALTLLSTPERERQDAESTVEDSRDDASPPDELQNREGDKTALPKADRKEMKPEESDPSTDSLGDLRDST